MALFANAPKNSHFLSLLTKEYGVGWEHFLVQTRVQRCRLTCGQSVDERLMKDRLAGDKAEIKYEEIYSAV